MIRGPARTACGRPASGSAGDVQRLLQECPTGSRSRRRSRCRRSTRCSSAAWASFAARGVRVVGDVEALADLLDADRRDRLAGHRRCCSPARCRTRTAFCGRLGVAREDVGLHPVAVDEVEHAARGRLERRPPGCAWVTGGTPRMPSMTTCLFFCSIRILLAGNSCSGLSGCSTPLSADTHSYWPSSMSASGTRCRRSSRPRWSGRP
jgi:hypothetical protein